jgi:hypothetical protein
LRAEAFTAPRLALRAGDLRAVVERAEVLRVEDFAADLAEVFRAVVFFAAVFFAAVLRAEDFAADLAEVFRAVVFLAAVFFAEDFTADLAEVFFAAVFFAAVFVPAFFALLRAEEVLAFLALDLEPLLAPLFLVLVAPVSPVNNAVSGLDLTSIGIAASFKGLRVQPSRLQGNVVIPTRFR